MIIQFFSSFAKKENSTKRPVETVDRSLTGVLKESCSIMEPTVKIERLPQDACPSIYTYAIIPSFQRFYFVEDWSWVDGLWEVRMKEDVLATYKNTIGETTEYVLRTDSDTTNFNGEITDITYPATTDFYNRVTKVSLDPFDVDLITGCYVVGIISGGQTVVGSTSDNVGAITYYAMSSVEFNNLKEMLFSDDNLKIMEILDSQGTQIVQDISYELLKTLYNPYQYIVSCMWFPFTKQLIPSTEPVQALKIGWWAYPLSGDRIHVQTLEVSESIGITPHPQASTRGSYLNYAPYTRRTLIGRYGSVAIDSSYFKEGDGISVTYLVDIIGGKCRAQIERTYLDGEQYRYYDLITERNFLLGVPIQLAQVGVDYLGTAVNAINTVSQATGGAINGIISGKGAIMGAIAGSASGIYNTIEAIMPQVETSGTNGGFITAEITTTLNEQFFMIVEEDIHHRGRPLCENRRLDTLTGFILCAEGDMDINCFDNERKAISTYLTTGFFWE